MAEPALGVDLGATNLRVGLVAEGGALSAFEKREMPWSEGAEGAVAYIERVIRGLIEPQQVSGVGVAVAATLAPTGEILEGPHNLPPEFGQFPLSDRLEEALAVPCRMGNDANLALLGEATFGAARGAERVLLLTLGTGIGAGLLLNGELVTGRHGSAGEIGLWPSTDPDTGAFVPVESLAAPGAIMTRLGKSGQDLFELIEAGDADAEQMASYMFRTLGQLVASVHLLLDLDLVLLSGGLAASGERVRASVAEAFSQICPPPYQFDLPIRLGELPADAAGVIGAASLFLRG